jgi:hypothetical protein
MAADFNYNNLCPGIRDAVRWFHAWSWNTCDSGDGSHALAGMEGAMEEPMVVVTVEDRADLCANADLLLEDLEKALGTSFDKVDVQAMYNPRDGIYHILVFGAGLLSLQCPVELR